MPTRLHPLLNRAFQPRAALLLWSTALLAAIVAAPLAASSARPEAWFLYQAFAPFCHQIPQRSWEIQGYPLAVCARCCGVYGGLFLAALLGLAASNLGGRHRPGAAGRILGPGILRSVGFVGGHPVRYGAYAGR